MFSEKPPRVSFSKRAMSLTPAACSEPVEIARPAFDSRTRLRPPLRRSRLEGVDGERRQLVLLWLVAVVWLGTMRAMAVYGAPLLPRALAEKLSLHSFLSVVLVVATAVGLCLSFALIGSARRALGLERPRLSHLAAASLAAPIVSVLSALVAYRAALPTLVAELAHGGRQAVERNTGELGRSLVESHVLTTLLFAVVLAPMGEELVFRGALWSAITQTTKRLAEAPRSLPPELLDEGVALFVLRATRRWLGNGGAATIATAAVFVWMHADQQGGAGIVRVVQTACLGIALGGLRHATGSVSGPIVLHALFNLMAVARLRRWDASPGWPPPLPIAQSYWQAAALSLVALGLWLLVHLWRRASARAP